ncbi:hypothetical protein [Nocardia wallacei]|uniref:hypothetical protein n=1 Tax=Nocardia wallacei TaxID=480035 RepID=UPI00313B2E56
MLAAGAVWPGAAAEFDFAFVEMFDEVVPLGVGDTAIFLSWPQPPSLVEMCLVVAHDVLVEDGDVAAEGFQVEVAQQRRTDMNGQSAVGQLGGEQAPEVVRCEVQIAEGWIRR